MIADAVDHDRADSVRDVREAILDREDNAVVQRIALGRAVEPHGHDRARFFDFQQLGWVRSRGAGGVSHGIYYVLCRIVISYNDLRSESIHSSKASSPRKAGTHMWTAPVPQEFFRRFDRIACVHMSGLLMR